MALKVGSLYVSLSANTSGLIKGFAEAAKATEKVAKEIKKVSNDVAGAAAGFTAIGAAAMKLASSVDGPAKKSMEGLEKSMQLVAVQVADIIMPAVDALSKSFRELAGYIAGIDPETKKSIATFATWAAGLAVGAKVLATISGLVSTFAGALSGIAGIIASIGFGPLIAGLAAIIVGVAAAHRAWRTNWAGIQDATREVVEFIRAGFSRLGEFFGKFWRFALRGAEAFVDKMLGVVEFVERVSGVDLGSAGLREGFSGMFKDLYDGSFFSDAFEWGKRIGTEIVDGVVGEWGIIGKEMKALLGALNVSPVAPRQPTGEALPTVGTMETGSAAVMSFVGELQKQADMAKGATDAIAVAFSNAEGDAVSAEMHQKAIAEAAAAAAAHAAKMRAQLKATVGIVLQNSGALGQVIQSVAQGAQQGGVWGAIIAAVMEVFQRMASWKALMDIFEAGLKRLGEFLEPLLSQIFDVVGTFTQLGTEILQPLIKAFKPIFDSLSSAARRLMPIFDGLGRVFEALGPLIEMAIKFGEQFSMMGPLIDLLNGVFKAVSIALLTLMWGANSLLASFGDANAQREADRIQESLKNLWQGIETHGAVPAMELGDTLTDTSGSLTDLAVAADRVSESLTNVPAGYKVALARYNADFGASPAWNGGMPPPPPPTTIIINGDIKSDASSFVELSQDAIAEAKRRRGQLNGNPLSAGGNP